MHIVLTPAQAVTLHGWLNPREMLTWQDVVNNENITFTHCRACNISLKNLHKIQGTIAPWLEHGAVTMGQAVEMSEFWEVNLIPDFHVDLSDVLSMQLTPEQLRKVSVTYDALLNLGMTPATMQLFGFTLTQWMNIGLQRKHLQYMTDAHIVTLFGMTRQNCECAFAIQQK
jgi:hypothetical protein